MIALTPLMALRKRPIADTPTPSNWKSTQTVFVTLIRGSGTGICVSESTGIPPIETPLPKWTL
jgi:hypothetical protein